jgi:hypothetical protein
MKQVLIAYDDLKDLHQKIDALTEIVMELKNSKATNQSGYITSEEAQERFKLSRETISKRVNKYKVETLPLAGTRKLINEAQLILALQIKQPVPNIAKKKYKEVA